jgi:hypothetical protein
MDNRAALAATADTGFVAMSGLAISTGISFLKSKTAMIVRGLRLLATL